MSRELTVLWPRLRRAAYFGVVGLTTAVGVAMMAGIVSDQGLTVLEWVILALFAPTFAWIVMPFWTAVAGFVLRVGRRDPVTLARYEPLRSGEVFGGRWMEHGARTALVVPLCDEDPDLVGARVSAMIDSLERAGAEGAVHVHLLSDSRNDAIASREERVWVALQARHPGTSLHYRRRRRNEGRKAGNVGEFCRRCADGYDLMIVLDADSLMTGRTIVRLVDLMHANPDVGLIQTLPLPVLQRTLFGRLIQFAARVYGPLLASGQAFWYGDVGNYWGHNAIVRVRPFLEHARLPTLPGSPPLGGEVLSHDFVEAALLRRAGWRVVLVPGLEGSWEEVPANLPEYARRDRRWAQGSLQHLRLLAERGLHPLSRLHFVLGALGYVSSLLWLLTLLAGTAYVLAPASHGPALSVPGPGVPVSLLAITAALLFVPKALGLAYALGAERARFGGAGRLVASGLIEALYSVVLAPVMMLYHARFVLEIALGRAVGWDAQDRARADLTWHESWRAAWAPTLVGAVWGGATALASPVFFLWMSPIFAGLLVSLPLVRWTSRRSLGTWTRDRGLLLVPSETSPPPEVETVLAARAALSGTPRSPSGRTRPAPSLLAPQSSHSVSRSMYNAERGLFDLRQGRALLVTDGRSSGAARATGGDRSSSASSGVLVAAVEGLDADGIDRLRTMGTEPLRLVVTAHRVVAMGLSPVSANAVPSEHYSIRLRYNVELQEVVELSCAAEADHEGAARDVSPAASAEVAGLSLVRLARLLPAVVVVPVWGPYGEPLESALARGQLLQVDADEVHRYVGSAGAEVTAVSEAPVPLAEAVDSRFVLFREAHGLHEHVAILVGRPEDWSDPVPVRLHSACLTGDLFGSLRCDCGDQLRGSMKLFESRGGGVLLYLAQEGRGIGLRNKFRAYTLQEGGLDTIDADSTLGFGPDERRYDVAAKILKALSVERIELLTNNPEKVRALQEAGIDVAERRALHGTLTAHNRPYVEAKVNRAGHLLDDMLSERTPGD